jgi:hypothetical protein
LFREQPHEIHYRRKFPKLAAILTGDLDRITKAAFSLPSAVGSFISNNTPEIAEA